MIIGGTNVCPHCFCDLDENGYFVKTSFSGRGIYFYNSDGTAATENSQMYDTVERKESKTMYCVRCDGKLNKKALRKPVIEF